LAPRDLLFYAIGAALLGLALVTVTARNLFRAALGLLGVLWCTAMLFILLKAEMVALVQVMVYIGGIMIFVLYAVLLTSELGGKMPKPSWARVGGGAAAGAVFFSMLFSLARWSREAAVDIVGPGAPAQPANIAPLKGLGLRLLDPGPQGFLVPFELISVVLLAAMVGAIAIARQGKSAPGSGDVPAGKAAPALGGAAVGRTASGGKPAAAVSHDPAPARESVASQEGGAP
jgi:NADH-quinone oxidoreductase subunit J